MESSGSGGGLGIGQTYFEAFMKKKSSIVNFNSQPTSLSNSHRSNNGNNTSSAALKALNPLNQNQSNANNGECDSYRSAFGTPGNVIPSTTAVLVNS